VDSPVKSDGVKKPPMYLEGSSAGSISDISDGVTAKRSSPPSAYNFVTFSAWRYSFSVE